MLIIGFGHKKRTGKDTAVQFAMSFARQHFPSVRCEILSFGDQLKGVAYTMFKWAGLQEAIYYENTPREIDTILPRIGKSARMIWDEMGLKGREIHPLVWIQMAASSVPEEASVLFCKDMRFPSEVDLIDSFKGFKYRIDRDVAQGGAVDQALNDYTGWNGIIENNGGLKAFNLKIKTLVANHLNSLVNQDKLICPNCYAAHRAVLKGAIGGMGDNFYSCQHCNMEYKVCQT